MASLRDQLLFARVNVAIEADRRQLRELGSRARATCGQVVRNADSFATLEIADEQVVRGVEHRCERAARRVLDVEQRRPGEAGLAVEDDIADELTAAPQALDLEDAGIRDLDRLLAELDRVLPHAVRVAARAELVHAA